MQWSLNSHDKHLPTGQFSTILGDDRTHQTDTRGMVEQKFEPKLGDRIQSLTRAHLNATTSTTRPTRIPRSSAG